MAAPRTPAEAIGNLLSDARFGAGFLQRHGWRLVLVFVGLLLPLWGFAELADEVLEGEPFDFDEPILLFAREAAAGGLDRLFLLASKLGYEWGVVPVDILLVLGLALARRHREGLFAGVALAGSALLNIAAKQAFARDRPSLWESIAPEHNFSFPSGHAMGSMTLAMVLVLLCWHTRWRWPLLAAMALFVTLVGLSRVYLGVHYPSDILAGWTAALAWTAATWLLVNRRVAPADAQGLRQPAE
ncbi:MULTISPECIES: phosphatase PAP2 family protein [unclassified Luteimonas]|uniref:phosphatase PAP2 family protein n=1 Tax=unclassified Luteimonas TaxID=2629088 RepID=UPI0018F0DFB8|nr:MULTISPECIES: phosphatase PAP2 family protein [unclassified Luteimonas]MBJ6981013.1 phosphatase PAP2 family protein [Luteimonas sp. MC1572]MBJ7573718.1 phosphatase PAP2 family protein [Luteimonas sp. MC1828]QQO02358.1 phosphatase PAP2 family protein [Luteimonas sp. MC1572]